MRLLQPRPAQTGEMGWMEPYQVEIHKWFANASGIDYPLVSTQPGTENRLAEKDLQDLGGLFQLKWFCESAACPCSKGRLHLGLQQQKCSQEIGASDSFLLFEALEDTPGVPYPVLGIPQQERHQHAGAGSVQSCQEGGRLESAWGVERSWEDKGF